MVLVGALTQASVASAAAPPKSAQGETGPAKTKNEAFPRPGHLNAITDVAGIQVGQYSRTDGDYQTGTTVVRAPDGAVNGVSVPGGWPGTINTDVLDPKKNPQLSDAVFLSGGSYYGLATFGGVMRWMEQHCEGLQVGPKRCDVDPLVSGAIVFDLGRGGDFDARPTADFGYRAADNTQPGRVAQGNVGAGTGTHSTPFKGGIGTASIEYKDGLTVGALIAVNAGTAVNPNNCGFYARYLGLGDEFKGLRLPTKRACRKAFATNASAGSKQPAHPHTAIAVVATNAGLSDAQTAQMASRGGDGEVIAIDTIHTLGDGDTIFALSTDKWKGSCDQTDCLERVYAGATKTIARAVVHALLNAKSTQGIVSYCDTFARACKHLAKS
ncbi:MAG: P1 family peptidase [Streptosporangiales bacterium]